MLHDFCDLPSRSLHSIQLKSKHKEFSLIKVSSIKLYKVTRNTEVVKTTALRENTELVSSEPLSHF